MRATGKAPDVCDVPPARCFRREDVRRKLRDRGVDLPSCFDMTGWLHFLGTTVNVDAPEEMNAIWDRLLQQATSMGPVEVANEHVLTEEEFTALTRLW